MYFLNLITNKILVSGVLTFRNNNCSIIIIQDRNLCPNVKLNFLKKEKNKRRKVLSI